MADQRRIPEVMRRESPVLSLLTMKPFWLLAQIATMRRNEGDLQSSTTTMKTFHHPLRTGIAGAALVSRE